jgi:NADH-quinone oxidoreductase subunit L
MLIPLGVLALGAVFSGMLWYNVFFGDEAKLRTWFGMEAAAAHGEVEAEAAAREGTPSHDRGCRSQRRPRDNGHRAAPAEGTVATEAAPQAPRVHAAARWPVSPRKARSSSGPTTM